MLRATSCPVAFAVSAALAVLIVCAPAQATPRSTVLLLFPKGAVAQDFGALAMALEAHLAAYSLEVVVSPVPRVSPKPAAQERLAREVLIEKDALAVVWIDAARQEANLVHLGADGSVNRLDRRFGCIARGLSKCADTIASVVSFALSSWLGPPPQKEEEGAAEPAFDNELSPMGIVDQPWTEPEPVARLRAALGYAVTLADGVPAASHGGIVELGAVVARYLAVEARADFFWRLRGDSMENGGSLAVGRFDAAGRLGGELPLRRSSLALTAGVTTDVSRVKERSARLELERERSVRVGFSTRFTVRLELNGLLGLALGGGVDVFDSEAAYAGAFDAQPPAVIVSLPAVQGQIHLALEFGWDVGRMRAHQSAALVHSQVSPASSQASR